ncbi:MULTISPECIES: hypothetical protein [unclassified Methylocaldum]|jgi:hypothetical protein|uniref:hypothetical protein n=1 Tax=unclassified Methylocaldum TaxID=2622260 RepID=UPI000A326AC9|nr:hypothetical protein [Methylocaldum sp. RMAD-M]MBP1153119.1 hypothetical protein [Methylocaldum sp. RMAD-M]MVF23972.1 hypothetical protein [Methylocaldum sp. BRCS4]
MSEKLTEDQLQTLRHMLGIDDPSLRDPKPYRDYYCANRRDQHLQKMAQIGVVRLYSQQGGYDWYCTTEKGRAAAIESHRRIRYPRRKRVYLKYLDIRDITGCTFKQFLTEPEYAECRRTA